MAVAVLDERVRALTGQGFQLDAAACEWNAKSGRQRMTHIEICDIAVSELHMEVQDLFVLTQKQPLPHVGRSQHARKNHSYLWVFRKQTF